MNDKIKLHGYGSWEVKCVFCHEKRFIKAHKYKDGRVRGENSGCHPCRAKRLSKEVLVTCPGCGYSRYIKAWDIKYRITSYCVKCCKRKGKPKIKNGVHINITSRGYAMVVGVGDHPLANKSRQVREHWYVFYNESDIDKNHIIWFNKNKFTLHHKNGIRDDNRIENLELMAPGRHGIGWTIDEMRRIVKMYDDKCEK